MSGESYYPSVQAWAQKSEILDDGGDKFQWNKVNPFTSYLRKLYFFLFLQMIIVAGLFVACLFFNQIWIKIWDLPYIQYIVLGAFIFV